MTQSELQNFTKSTPESATTTSNETVQCPWDGCEYESSEQGVKIHYGKQHPGSIGGFTTECDYCGKTIRKHEYRNDRNKNLFCSHDCHDAWRAENIRGEDAGGWEGGHLIEVTCGQCGKTMERRQDHAEKFERHFCDDTCQGKWLRETGSTRGENNGMFGRNGEDHPGWKGGVDDFRLSKKWQRFRRKTYRRDGFTCQDCGATNVELHAHHITPVSEGGPKYDLDNLVTLCAPCHWDRHSK